MPGRVFCDVRATVRRDVVNSATAEPNDRAVPPGWRLYSPPHLPDWRDAGTTAGWCRTGRPHDRAPPPDGPGGRDPAVFCDSVAWAAHIRFPRFSGRVRGSMTFDANVTVRWGGKQYCGQTPKGPPPPRCRYHPTTTWTLTSQDLRAMTDERTYGRQDARKPLS